jgi:uncharacterized protein (DUF58 family)
MKFGAFFSFLRLFKAGGIFVCAAGTAVFIRGLAWRDPYEIVLAGAALFVWCALFFTGFFGIKRLQALAPGWTVPVPLSAGGAEPHVITGLDQKVPWFFRLHFILKGGFSPAAGKKYRFSSELTGAGEASSRLRVGFPLSGVFHGKGFCCLRDVFGFFSFPCGLAVHRSLSVQPAPFHKKPPLRIDPFSGSQDRQSRSQTDEERYYMREYAPGDRFRDINWKTSERLATLITRISPHTQEKTRLVHIALRNYGPALNPPLLFVWLLDRIKARLALFLRALKEAHPEFIFHITTASDEKTIQTEEELAAFFDELAALGFRPPAAQRPAPAGENGELHLFSTSCDTGLPALLASRGEAPSHLYISVPVTRRFTQGAAERNSVVFHAGALFAEGFLPVSGFIPRREVPGLETIPAPRKGSREIIYAEVRL